MSNGDKKIPSGEDGIEITPKETGISCDSIILRSASVVSLFTPPAVQLEYEKAAKEYMDADLAKSGLTAEDIGAVVAPAFMGTSVAYKIPYFNLDGSVHEFMHRVKGKVLDPLNKELRKYNQPSAAEIGVAAKLPYFPPGRREHAHTGVGDIHEGEKKAACAVKQGQFAIGIGGNWNWCSPTNKDAVHPDILADLEAHKIKELRLWPDGDVGKVGVQTGWGKFARCLKAAGFTIKIMDLRAMGKESKFDDMVALHGIEHVMRNTGLIDLATMRITAGQLLEAVPELEAAATGEEGQKVVLALEANFAKILRNYPLFEGQFWYDAELQRFMLGAEPWEEGLTVPSLLETFQTTLGFNRRGSKGNTASLRMVETSAVMVARENKRHPFREYLHAVAPRWDKTPRLETWLRDYCDAEDTTFAREAGKRILVAAVARTFKPGCPLRWALILKGPQKMGKSGIPEFLFGREQWGDLEKHMVQNKDGQILLVTAACVRHDELAALTSATEAEHLKSLISKSSEMFRPPYDKSMRSHPARCIHIGSTNDDKFLRHDPSGNNRWVVVNVSITDKKFDFPGLYQVRDQLWAEAVHLYRAGHEYETVPDADAEARKYEQHNLYTDKLERLFGSNGVGDLLPLPSDPSLVYTSLSQICDALQIGITGANMVVQRNIGAALKELGFSKKDRPRGTGITTAWCIAKTDYELLRKKAAIAALPQAVSTVTAVTAV